MNIESLEMFCLVVDEGSISHAARLSYVSQPAVTRQIRQLENLYGSLLFNRADGKMKLTKAGETLYPYAKEIIDNFKRSKEAIQHVTKNYNTTLNIGATLTIGEYLLPRLLGLFDKNFPDINLTLSIGNTPDMLSQLADSSIDLALIEGIVKDKELDIKKIADDELILVVPPNHRWKNREGISTKELAEEQVIWREAMSGTRIIVENALEDCGILGEIKKYMELGSTQSIKSAVEAGLGISILPKLTVEKELKYGLLLEVPIFDLNITRGLWMVQKPRRFQRIGLNHFIEFLKQQDFN